MSRSWISLAVLFLVVAALGAFVYFGPRSARQQEYHLSSLKADDAQRLRVQHPGKPVIELARQSAQWRMNAPFPARAEAFQVQRVLAILGASAATRLAATDLARFGLDRPLAEVKIDEQTFAYGAVSPVTGELYVRAARYLTSLPPASTAFIARQMFALDETPVRLEFPQFRVAQESGRWTVTPRSSELSQDDISRWVDNWRQASALRAEPDDGPMPAKHITIELKDGRRVAFGVEEKGSELAFTRYDEHVRYYLFPSMARVMLAPPQGEPLGTEKRRE
jgi:hypothetical protein